MSHVKRIYEKANVYTNNKNLLLTLGVMQVKIYVPLQRISQDFNKKILRLSSSKDMSTERVQTK